MGNAVDMLVDINSQINEASIENNFSRVLFLDSKRRALLKSLATNPDFRTDERSLKILKTTAEENQKLMTQITERMSALTQATGSKIKMLRSYRMAK